MKKIISFVLVLSMVLSLSVSSFATNELSLVKSNSSRSIKTTELFDKVPNATVVATIDGVEITKQDVLDGNVDSKIEEYKKKSTLISTRSLPDLYRLPSSGLDAMVVKRVNSAGYRQDTTYLYLTSPTALTVSDDLDYGVKEAIIWFGTGASLTQMVGYFVGAVGIYADYQNTKHVNKIRSYARGGNCVLLKSIENMYIETHDVYTWGGTYVDLSASSPEVLHSFTILED